MDNAGVAKPDLRVDIPAHEATYAGFIGLTENVTVHILNIILLLVLWGLEGHPFVALFGFFLNIAMSAIGAATGLGWRLSAAVFVFLGALCIIL